MALYPDGLLLRYVPVNVQSLMACGEAVDGTMDELMRGWTPGAFR